LTKLNEKPISLYRKDKGDEWEEYVLTVNGFYLFSSGSYPAGMAINIDMLLYKTGIPLEALLLFLEEKLI
jgi:hypothetical protein